MATQYVAKRPGGGPIYLRFGKAGEPNLTQKDSEPFVFGKLRYLRRGSDVCVLSYGVIMKMAAEIADGFAASGKSVSLISCHTLKPLDREGISEVLRRHKQVIVVEEHAPQGGLAPQTKQIAWDIGANCRIDCFTLKDEFVHCYGSHEDILAAHGLSAKRILQATM